MKTNSHILVMLLLFSLLLGACQSSQVDPSAEDGSDRSPESIPDEDTAYPVEEEPDAPDPTAVDAAYPITEAELDLLHKTWESTVYTEDGIVQDPHVKTLQFNADGTYTMTTDSETTSGEWTARLSLLESKIILTDNTGNVQTYEMITLEENQLILQSWRETIQIEQQFQPAE